MDAATFAAKARAGEVVIGYFLLLDSPLATERIARTGYDYMCIDGQHGLLDYAGWISGMQAIDAAGVGVGIIRVPSTEAAGIGRALDAGAAGIIVPLVNNADDAAAAVAAAKYPPAGIRSYGPMRSGLRIGPQIEKANADTLVLAMIETPEGIANAADIAAVDGIDGLYIGPTDLTIALGGKHLGDPAIETEFAATLTTIRDAAKAGGKIAAIHTASGDLAAERLAAGFTFITIASDLMHAEQIARSHLETARRATEQLPAPDLPTGESIGTVS